MGIEPTWPAWKAGALPLSYTRLSSAPTDQILGRPALSPYTNMASGTAQTNHPAAPWSGAAKFEALVEGEGFEPSYAFAGRFTVCCL